MAIIFSFDDISHKKGANLLDSYVDLFDVPGEMSTFEKIYIDCERSLVRRSSEGDDKDYF